MSVSDTAVGAILEIPPALLNDIQKAERHIDNLQITSKRAAEAVANHWGNIATGGLETFIQKLSDAQNAMKGLGTINVTLNTNAAIQSTEQLSTATQKTSSDVSKAVQDMAQSWSDFAEKNSRQGLNLFSEDLNSVDKLKAALESLRQKRDALIEDERGGAGFQKGGFFNRQELTDQIDALEKIIKLLRQSTTQREEANKKVADKNDKIYLDEQKRLLADILDLRKQVNAQAVKVVSGSITKSENLERDKKDLNDLYARYQNAKKALEDYNAEKLKGVSTEGLKKADINILNQENALLKEQLVQREKLNTAIQKGNEYNSQAQASKARISNSEEGRTQRQLNSDYKAMINIIKEQGEIKAKVASEGRNMNQQEISLIAALAQRYKIYYDDIQRVSGAFTALSEARRKAFESDRTEQLARNAVALADANEKAAQAANKHGLAMRDAASLEAKIQNVTNQINQERDSWQKVEQKVRDAQAAFDAVKNANPNFNTRDAELKLDSLKGKIERLYEQLNGGVSSKKENRITKEIEQLKQQYSELDKKLLATKKAAWDLADAQDNAQNANTRYGQNIAQLESELRRLEKELLAVRDANVSINAEISKGNTAKSLASEYVKLTKRLQEVNDAMNKFQASGGNVNSSSFKALQTEWQNIMARRKEIEKMDIAEVNQYRTQMSQSAYQQDLSAFIQAEAQKKAEALKTIQETNTKRQEAWQKYLQSYEGAMKQVNALSNGNRSGKYTDTYENRARVIKNLEAAIKNLNKTDADYESKLKDLTNALNKLKSAQEAVKNAMKPIVSPQDAINMAKNASTLRELEAAYKALREAMANTKTSDPQWTAMNTQLEKTKANIDEIKKKMGEFQSQASKTSGVVSQLQSRIAAAFSVAAINGFIKKMVETRAQFELQRVALGAIIQDRDEANKIFTQVQNMALESPFSIMQLERATKQIAAFGFEAKKLVPTMKMFADISAGLGVEIDRLVLVMGHLKARNFLEGTMVRQFTNMGFNILGELSKYYSELENKMVSVGEVQDRVKKKMVSFADVEEVLKRVTSAGGMFYDMQKKQSDSIWGQMQRITDAYDLMLNEIGQSNEGSIKMALTTIRTLINSWRSLVPIIQAAGAAMIVYSTVTKWSALTAGVKGMATAFKNLRTVIWGTKAAQDALNASQKANAWGLLASLIVAAAVAIYDYATAQSKLNESLDRVRNEGIGNMYELLTQYKQLADTVRDTNKPYEEQKQALDEIQRVYAEILPAEMLEIKNIKAMTNGYEEATAAIKAYSAEKIKANLKSEIQNIVGSEISSQEIDLADWITFNFTPDEMPKNTFRAYIKTILAEVSEEVKNGSIPVENALAEFKKRTTDRLGNIVSQDWLKRFNKISTSTNMMLLKNIREWTSSLQKYQDEMSGVDIGIDGAESKQLTIVKDRYEQVTTAVDNYKKAIEALRVEREKGTVTGDVITDENGNFVAKNDGLMGAKALENLNKSFKEVQENAKEFAVTWNTTADDVNAAIESQTGQMGYFEQVNETVFSNILKGFNNWSEWYREDKSVEAWVQNANRAQDALDLSPIQNKILGIATTVTVANNMQIGSLDKLRLESLNSFGDAAKAAQSVYNQLAANEIAIQTQIKSLVQYGYAANEAKTMAEEQFGAGLSLEEIKEMMKLYKELVPAFGGTFKDSNKSKNSSDKELKRWQGLKKAIEDVRTAYEKYRKSYNVEESNARIEKLFGPAFKELGHDISEFYKNGKYDAEALVDALEVLKGMTEATTEERKKFRSEIKRKIGTTQVEIEVKMKEDAEKKLKADLDEMFANYELSEELKKIGVSVDLTYMVGGKPTTLQSIRAEIARLRAEGGDKADAENRIKILEEAEKKITQMELKAQKERLKNYEKYLKTMYSDRAKTMIDSYATLEQMERDFQKNIQQLQDEMNAPDTSAERKKELAGLIASLKSQANEAAVGIQRELSEALTKADWNSFKGSEIFESMYQDLDTLSKKGIDALIQRLETVRDKLQSVSDIDPKAVREVTQYIEKLKNAKINLAPYTGFKEALSAAKELKKEYGSIEAAQLKLVELNDSALGYEQEVADLETIIALLDRKVAIEGRDTETTARLNALYEKYKDNLQGALATARQNMDVTKEQASALGITVNNAKKLGTAYQAQISKMQKYRESVEQITNAVFEIADALGGTVDEEWKNLASSIINATFQGIQLQLQMQILQVQAQLLGVAMNSALGIIGWVAIALQVVASLLTAIFAAKDKRLQKKIEAVQERVEVLSKSFEKLEKSIERAFNIESENRVTEQALSNLEAQKRGYEEMIRLEEAKKKTDDDKIKEYKDKLAELAEAEEELYEKRHEKYGSTNDVWDEANNWVDAWLDAYKETGDGLDALNSSWDEFYENLVKKQATSKVVGARMDKFIQDINNAIDKNMNEYGYVDAFKEIGERFKSEFADMNQGLKDFFEYAGIGTNGSLILSDLQKGIQNITEPQAAAIEAYLNSMRFAVFRHTEQLDTLITTIQAQYGSGAENPVVTELKGIRGVLDNIYSTLRSVVKTQTGKTGIVIVG